MRLRGLGHHDRLAVQVPVAALVTAVAAVVLARLRARGPRDATAATARAASAPRAVDVSEALDDGELPAVADPAVWTALLLRRREIHDQLGGPVALVVVGLLLAGTVLLAVLGGPPLAWTLPAVLTAIVAGLAVVRRRRVEQVDAILQPLLAAVGAEQDGPAHPAAGADPV